MTYEEYLADQDDLIGALAHKQDQIELPIPVDDEYYVSDIDDQIAALERRIREYEALNPSDKAPCVPA